VARAGAGWRVLCHAYGNAGSGAALECTHWRGGPRVKLQGMVQVVQLRCGQVGMFLEDALHDSCWPCQSCALGGAALNTRARRVQLL
jgi:hypothetical protein